MTTRRFLYVDTDLTAPPSPTGLPEGYAVILKTGQMFVIRGGVFKAANTGGNQARTGLPDATGLPVTIGGAASLFASAGTTAPSGYQADTVNDFSQTYGDTTNPPPPSGITSYTTIIPKGGAASGFHVIYPDADTRMNRGAVVSFKYYFDGDDVAAAGAEFAFFAALDTPPIRLFGAKGNPGTVGPTNNTTNWIDASFYFPPGGGNLYLYTLQSLDEGSGTPQARILLSDLTITPFDEGDRGSGLYDDTTGTQYIYDNGWRRLLDPYTLAKAQHDPNARTGAVNNRLATDYTVPIASTAVAPPVGVSATLQSGGQLLSATTYYWKITSLSARGESLGSTEVTAAVAADPDPNRTALLAWTLNAAAVGYAIYRGTASGAETLVDRVDGVTSSYVDSGVRGLSTAATVPTTDTTASGAPGNTHIRLGSMCNLRNLYRGFAGDATTQNYKLVEQITASLSLKHSGVTPSVTLELVARNALDDTETVIATQFHEDLTVGKYRGFTLAGLYRVVGVDRQDIDYLVRLSSVVDGTVTVLAGSQASYLEQLT